MYGVLLPFVPEYNNELFEPYIDSAFEKETNPKDGLTALDDGMNGEYIAIGHVVAKSQNHEGLHEPIKLLKPPEYNDEALHKLVTGLGLDHTQFNPGWIVLSHYR